MTFFMVLTASLIGSPHCAAMCGGIVAFYSGSTEKSITPHLWYNGARGVGYCSLGFLAGYIGESLDIVVGDLTGLQQAAALVTGAFLVLWGIKLFIAQSNPLRADKLASPSSKGIHKIWAKVFHSEKLAPYRPLLLGAISIFLPCGWLYAYVAVATASGSAQMGALTMFAFWLGTLPILLSIGGLGSLLSKTFGKSSPRVTACLLLLAGLLSIGTHLKIVPMIGGHSHGHHNHSMHTQTPTSDQATDTHEHHHMHHQGH